jgi:hypothetical protein
LGPKSSSAIELAPFKRINSCGKNSPSGFRTLERIVNLTTELHAIDLLAAFAYALAIELPNWPKKNTI